MKPLRTKKLDFNDAVDILMLSMVEAFGLPPERAEDEAARQIMVDYCHACKNRRKHDAGFFVGKGWEQAVSECLKMSQKSHFEVSKCPPCPC